MQVRIATDAPATSATGALVVPVFTDGKLDGVAAEVDAALGGAITRHSRRTARSPASPTRSRSSTPRNSRFSACCAGRPRRSREVHLRFSQSTPAPAVRYLGKRNTTSIAFALPAEAAADRRARPSSVAEGAMAGTIDATTYRTEPEKPIVIDEVSVLADRSTAQRSKRGIERGTIVGEAVNFARLMALTPATT